MIEAIRLAIRFAKARLASTTSAAVIAR